MTPTTTHRTVPVNGAQLHIAEMGDGPPVVLLHGFPELWYSWRHQLPALAAAGYHALAPDLRGFGRTTAPEPVEAYSMRNLVADVTGLLDAAGAPTAVLVGHDWGANIAWTCAQLHPDRVTAVAALSVPFTPRPPAPPTQLMRRWAGDHFNWMLYFQEPGVAEAELEADVERSLRRILWALSGDAPADLAPHLLTGLPASSRLLDAIPEPGPLSGWLGEDDLGVYVREFERTGFTGGLNRYRNVDRDWEELAGVGGTEVTPPTLFVGGELDTAVRLQGLDPMRAHVPDLREPVILPGCGHWVQQERPREVNDQLLAFLRDVAPAT